MAVRAGRLGALRRVVGDGLGYPAYGGCKLIISGVGVRVCVCIRGGYRGRVAVGITNKRGHVTVILNFNRAGIGLARVRLGDFFNERGEVVIR